MRLKPDFTRTVTGYVWLDWLTNPWWVWRTRVAERKLWRTLGGGDWREGRDLMREALNLPPRPSLDELLGRDPE